VVIRFLAISIKWLYRSRSPISGRDLVIAEFMVFSGKLPLIFTIMNQAAIESESIESGTTGLLDLSSLVWPGYKLTVSMTWRSSELLMQLQLSFPSLVSQKLVVPFGHDGTCFTILVRSASNLLSTRDQSPVNRACSMS